MVFTVVTIFFSFPRHHRIRYNFMTFELLLLQQYLYTIEYLKYEITRLIDTMIMTYKYLPKIKTKFRR